VKPQIVQILAAGHAGREQRLHLLQLHRAGHDKPVKYTSLLKMRFKKVKRNSNNSTHNSICKTNLNHVAPLVDSRHLILEDIVFYYHFMSCKLPKLPTCADDTSSIAACSRGRWWQSTHNCLADLLDEKNKFSYWNIMSKERKPSRR
jgi:hypothetical protein